MPLVFVVLNLEIVYSDVTVHHNDMTFSGPEIRQTGRKNSLQGSVNQNLFKFFQPKKLQFYYALNQVECLTVLINASYVAQIPHLLSGKSCFESWADLRK